MFLRQTLGNWYGENRFHRQTGSNDLTDGREGEVGEVSYTRRSQISKWSLTSFFAFNINVNWKCKRKYMGCDIGKPKDRRTNRGVPERGGDKDFFLFLAWWVFLFNSHCPELRIWKKGYDRTRAISLASSTRWQEPSGKEGNWRRVGGGAAEEGRKEERDLWASEVDHCEASRVFTKFDVDFGFHNSIFDNIHPKNSRVPALCSQILCSPTLTLSPSLRLYAIHSAWWHSASVKSDCI